MQVGFNCVIQWKFANPYFPKCVGCDKSVPSDQIMLSRQVGHPAYRCIDCLFKLRIIISQYTIDHFDSMPLHHQLDILQRIKVQNENLRDKPTFDRLLSKDQSIQFKQHVIRVLLDITGLPNVLHVMIVECLISESMVLEVDQTVHCLDNHRSWAHAQIQQIHVDKSSESCLAYVTYPHWSSDWNECIEFNPHNIRIDKCNCDPTDKQQLQGDF